MRTANTFVGTCDGCQVTRPGCALVYLRTLGHAPYFSNKPTVLCGYCRRHGSSKYVLDRRHRRKKAA